MRTWYRNLDAVSIMAWIGLVLAGLVAIYSATHGPSADVTAFEPEDNFIKQLLWLGISVFGVLVALMLPVRFFQLAAFPVYIITTALLVVALLIGREVNGSKSWIYFGQTGIQVSELAKVGTVMAVAQLVGMRRPKTMDLKFAFMLVALILVPAALIVLQNDTGTALVFFGLIPIALFWSGIELNLLLVMVGPAFAGYLAVVFAPAAYLFAIVFTGFILWRTRDKRITIVTGLLTGGITALAKIAMTKVLSGYQLARVLSFTDPGAEEFRQNVGFHQVNSMAAIGSGGFAGKGFMEGTQTQGGFVMEQSTDFIFSVIGEEFGFIGSVVVLGLFALLLVRLLTLGSNIKHPFGVMMAGGVTGVYLIHIFINVGMATSLLPVVGIPLPFISYGGSALLANSALFAIVLSLHLKRDDFSIYGY
ncbi:MAG: FtsW/RodA/SpoVE family cell cycle protein [Bacteroidetes bacterium]|nr:FtsW/RodA/SpoVE family cell cycle protein [Bacteroidota bacterium]